MCRRAAQRCARQRGAPWWKGYRDTRRRRAAQPRRKPGDSEPIDSLRGSGGLTTGVQLLARARLRVLALAGRVTVGCNGMLGAVVLFAGPCFFEPVFLEQSLSTPSWDRESV
jgi:hypothetical protein